MVLLHATHSMIGMSAAIRFRWVATTHRRRRDNWRTVQSLRSNVEPPRRATVRGLLAASRKAGVHSVRARHPPDDSNHERMHREYHRWYSPVLGRDMEMLVFGHAGARMLAF